MSNQKFAAGDIVRHTKGGRYRVIGKAVDAVTLEEVYVYRDGRKIWVRQVSEFEDGRFTLAFRPRVEDGEEVEE